MSSEGIESLISERNWVNVHTSIRVQKRTRESSIGQDEQDSKRSAGDVPLPQIYSKDSQRQSTRMLHQPVLKRTMEQSVALQAQSSNQKYRHVETKSELFRAGFPEPDEKPGIELQPPTPPITQGQVINEVTGA